jgi:hypothetical protein
MIVGWLNGEMSKFTNFVVHSSIGMIMTEILQISFPFMKEIEQLPCGKTYKLKLDQR